MSEELQDLFISHAGSDKVLYVQPLTDRLTNRKITFWLDSLEIEWGDSIPLRVNDGLRRSRYVLLCLSRDFLKRPWPEAELASALAVQNATGQKRVLPLILNAKESVLSAYPLLASLSYKEYAEPPDTLVDDLERIVRPTQRARGTINVIVESVHTGKLCNIDVSPRVSVKWLADRAQSALGVSDRAQTGAYEPFRLRWVLVDAKVENAWLEMPRWQKRKMHAIVAGKDGPRLCKNDRDRLADIGVADGVVFHLYAIEDERYDSPAACAGAPS